MFIIYFSYWHPQPFIVHETVTDKSKGVSSAAAWLKNKLPKLDGTSE